MIGYKTPASLVHPRYWDPVDCTRYRFDINQNCPGYKYVKPKIVKQDKMRFPINILNKYAGKSPDHICRQCSS